MMKFCYGRLKTKMFKDKRTSKNKKQITCLFLIYHVEFHRDEASVYFVCNQRFCSNKYIQIK